MRHFFYLILVCSAVLPVLASSCLRLEYTPSSSVAMAHDSHRLNMRRAGGVSFIEHNAKALIYDMENDLRLEAFQDIRPNETSLTLNSCSGMKKAVVVVNLADSLFTYANTASYNALQNLLCDIRNEDPACPVMVGEVEYSTYDRRASAIELKPLLCRVELRFFDVDFKGTAYSSSKFTDAKMYLINICGLCPVRGNVGHPKEVLNSGEFNYYDNALMQHPELIYSNIMEGGVMYCYPFDETKLVIEGRIDGRMYYYPITLSKHVDMVSGGSYVMDVLIRSKGTNDPDIEAVSALMTTINGTTQWIENEGYEEIF